MLLYKNTPIYDLTVLDSSAIAPALPYLRSSMRLRLLGNDDKSCFMPESPTP